MIELFLNPAMLWGAGLAAAPIVLHLIMRQKPKHLEFPALRFVRQRAHSNSRRLRLRHLLLLLLRVGIICVLALALARPSMKLNAEALGGREAPVAAALVFETAARIEYRQQNETRLERAKALGGWLLDQLPEESDVAVFDVRRGSLPGETAGADAVVAANFSVDKGAARQRIDNLAMTPVADPYLEVVDRAIELLQTSAKERKELYLFTDLSRSAWATSANQRWRRRLEQPGGVVVYVIDVGSDDPRNFGLGAVKLTDEVLFKDGNLELSSELTCRGPGGEKTVELYLIQPDAQDPTVIKEEKLSQVVVKLAENGAAPVVFPPSKARGDGMHQGYVKLLGGDGLEADDRRYFTVEVVPSWNVLLAGPPPADDYARSMRKALAPKRLRLQQRAPFSCTVASTETLAQTLTPYAAICILDPGPISPEAWKELSTYVSGGGGLAIFLGRNARKQDFNTPAAQALLPGTLDFIARGETHLTSDRSMHPVVREFNDWSVPWDLWPVRRHWRLELDSAARPAVVMSFADGQPAIIERRVGQGKVLTITTPVSERAADPDGWNQLTGFEPWPFTVLAGEMLNYLVGVGELRLNYQPGDTAVLPLSSGDRVEDYVLSTPWGKSYGPRPAGRDRIEEYTTNAAGNYRVRSKQLPIDRGYSVNLPPASTDLARVEQSALDEAFGEVKFHLVRDQAEFSREVGAARVGRELYPWLIVALAVILALEHVIANRFYREAEQPASRPLAAAAA